MIVILALSHGPSFNYLAVATASVIKTSEWMCTQGWILGILGEGASQVEMTDVQS